MAQIYGISGDIQSVVDNILNTMYLKYVDAANQEDYMKCNITLLDLGMSFDMMNYYSEIQKLKLANYGLSAAIDTIPPQSTIPLHSGYSDISSSYLDSVNSDEFADQGFEMPVQTIEGRYEYHTVLGGETLKSIAVKRYGDVSRWTDIARANGITESDLIDDESFVGTIIKIPVEGDGYSGQNADNMVFERYKSDSTTDVMKYLLGQDFDNVNGGHMIVDESGDLKVASPVDSAINNIKDRIQSRKGSLNPLHPGWGIRSLGEFSEVPFFIGVEKLLMDVDSQIQEDPRVESGYVMRETVKFKGDAIWFRVVINLIDGSSFNEQIKI